MTTAGVPLYGVPMSSVKQVQVTFDCADPERVARFWCEVLGYVVPPPPDGFASWDDYESALPPEQRDADFACVDPTGAGDSFAGGFFGYLASQKELTPKSFRYAMFYGSVMGSYVVERFGTDRLQELTREEIDHRFKLFRELTHLD